MLPGSNLCYLKAAPSVRTGSLTIDISSNTAGKLCLGMAEWQHTACVLTQQRGDYMNTVTLLTPEQVAAIERKAAMLPIEVIENMATNAPEGSSLAEQYILRQIRREANNTLASQLRPTWIATLLMYVPTLTAKDENVRKNAERTVHGLADEISDAKDVVKVLTAVRAKLVGRTSNPQAAVDAVAQACKIFNIKPETLLK